MAAQEEEEEEETCHSWDHTTKNRRARTTHLWSHFHDHLTELFIISRELLILFGEMSCMLLQGHELLRLGVWYRLGAPNGWDTTSCPQVLGRSVGEFIHLISIGSTGQSCLHPHIMIEIWVGQGIIPYLSLNRLLCVSWKLKKKS